MSRLTRHAIVVAAMLLLGVSWILPSSHLGARAAPAPAAATGCGIQVTVKNPANGQVVRDAVSVEATVTSACEIQSVVATVPGLSVPLTFQANGCAARFGTEDCWRAS